MGIVKSKTNTLKTKLKEEYINSNFNDNIFRENLLSNDNSAKAFSESKKSLITNNEIIFIPCTICNSRINMNDIDSHSAICTLGQNLSSRIKLQQNSFLYQKQEKRKLANAETPHVNFHTNDYKLRKLFDHITILKNIALLEHITPMENMRNNNNSISGKGKGTSFLCNSTNNNDTYAIITLLKNLTYALNLSKIDDLSIKNLKKININIDNISPLFKVSSSIFYLIEISKVLVTEKIEIFDRHLNKNYPIYLIENQDKRIKHISQISDNDFNTNISDEFIENTSSKETNQLLSDNEFKTDNSHEFFKGIQIKETIK